MSVNRAQSAPRTCAWEEVDLDVLDRFRLRAHVQAVAEIDQEAVQRGVRGALEPAHDRQAQPCVLFTAPPARTWPGAVFGSQKAPFLADNDTASAAYHGLDVIQHQQPREQVADKVLRSASRQGKPSKRKVIRRPPG